MREICPSCGKDMIATTEAFEVNGDAVRGIPHLLCRSCGEATFTPEQLDMVFGYRTAQKQLKEDANYNREAIMYITREAEIASLKRDIAAAREEAERLEAEIEELKAKYEKLQAETAGKKAETEACDFADAAARDAIDALRVNQSPFS